jgi:hypothetical protein
MREIIGASVLADGRVLSWSDDRTLRLWDGHLGAPLRVFASPADWVASSEREADRRDNADIAAACPGQRALHHALHVGFELRDARHDLAVFTAGRELRICRFIPAGA